jgi:mannosyl-3-phosphoglycerate phosphatase
MDSPTTHAQPNPSILVFSELDDTLFEPHGRGVDRRARRTIERLGHARIPIVVCSSQTRAELELVQQELGIAHPFVCESGAAVFIPRGYFPFDVPHAREVAGYDVVELGKPYGDVVSTLHRVAERAGVEVVGFSDMSVAEVARECDLPLLQARLAKLREYNEPFRMVDEQSDEMQRLLKMLRGGGLECTQRARLCHAGTVRLEIGVQLLRGLYRRAFGPLLTVAFSDNANAVALLRDADIPLIVQNDRLDVAAVLRLAPMARLTTVGSVSAWVDTILDISDVVQQPGRACSH